MADWQTGMAGSRAGFGELMDDGLGRMMEEGRATISCQARYWSVTIWGTVMKRQAVIEGDGKVGARGMACGRAAAGLRGWDPAWKGAQPHAGQGSNCPFTWALPWAAACPRVLLTQACRTSSVS